MVKSKKIERTVEQLELIKQDSRCSLFNSVIDWVIQAEDYRSMANIVERIKFLEKLAVQQGIILGPIK